MYFYSHLIWIGFLIFFSIILFIIRARRAAAMAAAAASKPQSSVVVIEPASIPMHAYQAPVPGQFNHYQAHPQGFSPNPMQFQQPQQQQQFYPPLGQQNPYNQPQQSAFIPQQQTPYMQPQQAPYPQQMPFVQQEQQQQQQQQQQQAQSLQTNLQAAPFSPSIMSPPPIYSAATSPPDATYPALQPAPPVAFAIGSTSTSNAVNKGGMSPEDAITVDPKSWQPSPYPVGDGSTAGTAAKPRQPQAPQTLS
ncbi:hypothetical protein EC957_012084 [Mortierella hygrophila]|uniref:Uncharacterized protein n=1 Tax=Mortierella hygrophila TaxID=979708 RepID=A0A9P6F8I8_9FUNG|nr:hypothetical protein EC957_012084 [Mortierella hygrophila]